MAGFITSSTVTFLTILHQDLLIGMNVICAQTVLFALSYCSQVVGEWRSLGTEQGSDQRCKQYLGQLPIANYHATAVFRVVPSPLLVKGSFKYDEC